MRSEIWVCNKKETTLSAFNRNCDLLLLIDFLKFIKYFLSLFGIGFDFGVKLHNDNTIKIVT